MIMRINGFSAGINLPAALRGESLHRLPPYAPAELYPVANFPAVDSPVLEQYRFKCPVHGQAFTGNRHCAQCGFDWPGQN